MTIQTQMFLWGVIGSLAVDIITVANYINGGRDLPKRYYKPTFYLVRCLVAAVGGGLALAYEIYKPLLALNIGAATPLIIQQFGRKLPSDSD